LLRTENLDWRLDELESDISTFTDLIAEFELGPPVVLAGELEELEDATQEVCVSLDLSC
jgi:hypothetical protein